MRTDSCCCCGQCAQSQRRSQARRDLPLSAMPAPHWQRLQRQRLFRPQRRSSPSKASRTSSRAAPTAAFHAALSFVRSAARRCIGMCPPSPTPSASPSAPSPIRLSPRRRAPLRRHPPRVGGIPKAPKPSSPTPPARARIRQTEDRLEPDPGQAFSSRPSAKGTTLRCRRPTQPNSRAPGPRAPTGLPMRPRNREALRCFSQSLARLRALGADRARPHGVRLARLSGQAHSSASPRSS